MLSFRKCQYTCTEREKEKICVWLTHTKTHPNTHFNHRLFKLKMFKVNQIQMKMEREEKTCTRIRTKEKRIIFPFIWYISIVKTDCLIGVSKLKTQKYAAYRFRDESKVREKYTQKRKINIHRYRTEQQTYIHHAYVRTKHTFAHTY